MIGAIGLDVDVEERQISTLRSPCDAKPDRDGCVRAASRALPRSVSQRPAPSGGLRANKVLSQAANHFSLAWTLSACVLIDKPFVVSNDPTTLHAVHPPLSLGPPWET